ncbi:DsbA family protein [Staphylococcus kloosii]|uniref:DsbA family protein n=1 Tax=Staphylococcus kloosii TaxID=29384 RepID=UPI000D1DEB7D|nr:thioredoxin domain-containing protein [Staphylococcus kloosii]PTJ80241.1 hypothetical protein BUZ59_01260 [Staphylococcus kloosii]
MDSRKRVTLLLSVIAVILATVVIFQSKQHINLNKESKRLAQAINTTKQVVPLWGHNKASVTITQFGNYLCSHCKQFDRDIVLRLEKDFKNNPRVQFQYIDVPFSNEISNINSNVSQKLYTLNKYKYWDLHHKIFTASPKASELNKTTTAHYQQHLLPLIDQLKLDHAAAQTLQELIKKPKALNHRQGLAHQLNIDHVPVLYINQKRIENITDYKAIKRETINALNNTTKNR